MLLVTKFKQKFNSVLEFEAYLDALYTTEREKELLKCEMLLNVIRHGECSISYSFPIPFSAN